MPRAPRHRIRRGGRSRGGVVGLTHQIRPRADQTGLEDLSAQTNPGILPCVKGPGWRWRWALMTVTSREHRGPAQRPPRPRSRPSEPSVRGGQRNEAPELSGCRVPLKAIDDLDGDGRVVQPGVGECLPQRACQPAGVDADDGERLEVYASGRLPDLVVEDLG